MMNILYIGPNESEWAQDHYPGSLAGAKWARGFLSALAKIANVTVLTHQYAYPWPKGRQLWVGRDERCYPQGWRCEPIVYPSLKGVRELWLNQAYPRRLNQILRRQKFDVVLFYNCWQRFHINAMRVAQELGVPCVPIILDGDDPRKDNWHWMKEGCQYAAGLVMLSWWVFQNCPIELPRYHFDGGADEWCGMPPVACAKNTSTLVHTGALDQWRGLDFMIEIVHRMKKVKGDVKFVFCGKSSERVLVNVFGKDPCVELRGYVSEMEMERICNDADALLNVRDPHHPDNILNYPSKLPHYLSFGRPVVSTRLASLSPDYRQVVHFPSDDSVESYLAELDQVLGFDFSARQHEYEKIHAWFLKRKQWGVMTNGLVEWLAREVIKRHD